MQIPKKQLFNGVYDKQRVVITGNTGFKGSWASLWMSGMGADVQGISLNDCGVQSHHRLLDLKIPTLFADVRAKQTIMDSFAEFKPTIVFHMAAQPLVRASYQDPSFTFETNAIGTLNVLEAARAVKSVQAVMVITTDKVYENLETGQAYREVDRLGGYDPYSASKACAELITSSYRQSFPSDMLIASVRAGNVIGGGDWSEDRLIPDLVRAARLNQQTEIRSPQSTRPWQHVLDPLSGYFLLGQHLLEGQTQHACAWNFGPDKSANVPVIDVIQGMQRVWPKIKFHVNDEKARQLHEAQLLMLDCAKARDQLDWHPTWAMQETLQNTADWYRSYCEKEELISTSQLENYLRDAATSKQIWVS